MKYVSLDTWAKSHIDNPPSMATLRAWAASGRISGAAECGAGGSWRVPEDARLLATVQPARTVDPVVSDILSAA
ncbi:MAG: excisionase [Thiohalocapsa sp.]